MAFVFSPALRRRLAPAILIGGLLVLGRTVHSDLPREQQLRFVLGQAQRNARTVRITYLVQGEPLTAIEYHPRADAHDFLVHRPSLTPGPYDVAIEIEDDRGRVKALSRRLVVPSDPLTIRLDEPPKP